MENELSKKLLTPVVNPVKKHLDDFTSGTLGKLEVVSRSVEKMHQHTEDNTALLNRRFDSIEGKIQFLTDSAIGQMCEPSLPPKSSVDNELQTPPVPLPLLPDLRSRLSNGKRQSAGQPNPWLPNMGPSPPKQQHTTGLVRTVVISDQASPNITPPIFSTPVLQPYYTPVQQPTYKPISQYDG